MKKNKKNKKGVALPGPFVMGIGARVCRNINLLLTVVVLPRSLLELPDEYLCRHGQNKSATPYSVVGCCTSLSVG